MDEACKMNTPAGQGAYAEINFLEPWGRDDMSVGIIGCLLPSYPEAGMWVIEQENLRRNWLVTGVRLNAGEAG